MNSIKTEEGIANPFPLSDIQQYNKRLEIHSHWLKSMVILVAIIGGLALIYILWLTWYVIHTGAVNHYIARCV